MFALHEISNATLTGLTIDADHGFVGATDVFRIDRKIRNGPLILFKRYTSSIGISLKMFQTLLDRVLMRAREGGEDEIPTVRMALRHAELIGIFDRTTD